jgi:hypothetical protein
VSAYQSDVVVIDATGESAAQANALRRELAARGLRVKLDVIPNPDASRVPVPRVALDDSSQAACTVLLMPWTEGVLGYMVIRAPSKRGAKPVFVEPGTTGGGHAIESGELKQVADVAERVAEIVRRVTG